MKRLIFTTCLVFLLMFTGCGGGSNITSTIREPQSSTTSTGSYIVATVIDVVDGDTIKVSIDGVVYTVRYIGIDTPETVNPTVTVEYFGTEASNKNKELVSGKTVRLEKDVSETDKYGRLLRYVYAGDLFVNAELVRLGYAQVSTYPPDVKYQDLFLQLQREAREAGRGLWASTTTVVTTIATTVISVTSTSQGKYVGSINSDVYHYPTCTWAKQINEENQIWFATVEEAESHGYRPCKICNPH